MSLRFLVWTLSLLAAAPLPARAAPLFESHALLEVSLSADFSSLCRPRETEDCDFMPSTLVYRETNGEKNTLPVAIQVRGGWRSLSRNCSVPPLWVRFDPETTGGTLFEGQTLLPLTTHCGRGLSADPAYADIRRSDYEQYLLREYLGYRLYQQLTEYSLGARLLRIAYPKPGSNRGVRHYGFFTEHFDDSATRTDTQHLERGSFDPDRLDAQTAARLALFQYMIGNTDWSIDRERNIMLLQTADGRQLPVPYDLDMSGLVDAGYAGPAPGLPIDDVRDRYYLGYCQRGIEWNALFADYLEARPGILDTIEGVAGMSNNSKRSTVRFLDDFFDTLESNEERASRIVEACQPWPPDSDTSYANGTRSGR